MSVAAIPQPKRFTLSAEQQAILDWAAEGKGSMLIEAVAGAGKTFTLDQVAPLLKGTSAYAVFNKKNADEAKDKMGHVPGLSIGTCHSFGFAAWRQANDYVKVDAWNKKKRMLDENKIPDNLGSAVARLVSIAKQSMAGVAWDFDETDPWVKLIHHYDILWHIEDDGRAIEAVIADLIKMARRCIEWSRELRTMIDFDDMIWLPLLENVPIRQYDWVLLDECQDLNVSRQLLASRMLKKGGRLIAVGDRHQAVYGFSGADSDSLDHIAKEHGCKSLPLSTTYRCSKRATEVAQTFVPHIEAHENNNDGSVRTVSFSQFSDQFISTVDVTPHQSATPEFVPDSPETVGPGDAILCRLTRPLVALAFRLIREGIAAHVEGRNIGKQLERMATKWKVKTVAQLAQNLEGYRQHEMSRLLAVKADTAIEALNDRIDTLHIIMEGCELVSEVVTKIQSMFKDSNGETNTVLLSTVHRAKGREWNRVFILGWGSYMPSKWAKQDWELCQERNLQYVAVTRTKRDLILISDSL